MKIEEARSEVEQFSGKLEIVILEGGHGSIVPQSFEAFLMEVQKDLAR